MTKPALTIFTPVVRSSCKALALVFEELPPNTGTGSYIYKINTEGGAGACCGVRHPLDPHALLFIPMEGKPQMAQGALPKASLKEAIDKVMLGK